MRWIGRRRPPAAIRSQQPAEPKPLLSPEPVVAALYRGILGREPDPDGLKSYVEHLHAGTTLEELLAAFLASAEFRTRMRTELAPAGVPPVSPGTPIRKSKPVSHGSADFDVLFLQTADPYHYYDMLVHTSRTVRRFCQSGGFRYECYVGIKRGYYGWHAAYNRIILLQELIDCGYSGWVFYLDADAYIVDQDFDLREYLKDKQTYAAIFSQTWTTDVWHDINNGVFLINLGSKDAQLIVKEWLSAFMAIPDDTLRKAAEWGDLPHDQDLLHRVLHDHPGFRPAIHLESPDLLNGRTAWVRQVTRGDRGGFAERTRILRSKVEELLGSEEASASASMVGETEANAIVSGLYKYLLSKTVDDVSLTRYSTLLLEEGLEYGFPRVVEALVASAEFRARYLPPTSPEVDPHQAEIIGAALYRSLLTREPDWNAHSHIPALLRERGLERGLQGVIEDIVLCDEFEVRYRMRKKNAPAASV